MIGRPTDSNPLDRLRDEAGGLLVRRAVDRGDWITETLLDVAAGNRRHWTLKAWKRLLRDLRHSDVRIRDWLAERQAG